MQGNEVHSAFEILLEEIELVTNDLNEEGAQAFKAGNYEAARRAIEEATRLAEFHHKVRALQKEWASLSAHRPRHKTKPRRAADRRLPRGLRTPQDAFRQPILEALVELGGKASVGSVLDRVEKKIGAQLTKYDLEPLPSNPNTVRWRNSAQWCRMSLVHEGLMKSESPHGIWEISEAGRSALRAGTHDSPTIGKRR